MKGNHSPEAFHREFARLKKLAEREDRPAEEGAAEIDIARIRTCPAVFQPRGGQGEDEYHVRELTRALKAKGAGARLEPILVMSIGRDVYCVDGHHRLAAYRKAKVTGPIPVEWFGGTLRDAVGEAIKRNSQDKLPMSKAEKLEAAWRLTVSGVGSKADVTRLTSIADGTVANMRRTLAAIRKQIEQAEEDLASTGPTPPEEMTWHEARMFGKKGREYDEEWVEREAEVWAEKLRAAFGRKLARNPSLTAKALERYSPRLPAALAEEWGDADEDQLVNNDF